VSKRTFAKKLLSSNEVAVVERKKTFDKLPSKKREEEEDFDTDAKIIQLPQAEEEDLKEILANIPEEEAEEE